jgi:uncharacterized protein YodC (DUF2158 family)
MKANGRMHEVPVLTVVEHSVSRKGSYECRWVVLNSNGGQSAMVYHHLQKALYAAALETMAYRLWLGEDNTFCR